MAKIFQRHSFAHNTEEDSYVKWKTDDTCEQGPINIMSDNSNVCFHLLMKVFEHRVETLISHCRRKHIMTVLYKGISYIFIKLEILLFLL